ncbi:hypothetical protein BO94DRAFT_555303 [Aspergillus sclerotioniger CBS 115572]|uniref:Uncharacterized protein n=1 Tax=Aspergillus sclerotioniger CBS 115572 TaxID=1450535 RepID=A0A317X1J7_9EURO|nr:hypothetical protein BO94DRAFT_555303 [Aspergillus sclerotioniger CBS 115572]PWY91472.1 hypothetical protein BO94DRAFT_555303 [Aspergillus sclerotioniger CBS 115572]
MEHLRRSRSSRSIRRSHHSSQSTEPFDPELARLHATTAASRAMLRSKCSYDALGGPSNMAVPQRKHLPAEPPQKPNNVPIGPGNPHYRYTADNMDTSNTDPSLSAALPSISEFRGLDAGVAALPSSYRRLRKTRSMFSTGQRYSRGSFGMPSPESFNKGLAGKADSQDGPRACGTLRRSMSFFRGDSRASDALRHAKSHDAAIELARSHYQQSGDHPYQPRKSSLSIPKLRREHKPFRKTLRSAVSDADAASTPSSTQRTTTSSYGKARSLSSSIKKGIKKVLGLSKPPVHLHAERSSSFDQKRTQDIHSTVSGMHTDSLKNNVGTADLTRLGGSEGPVTHHEVKRTGSSESLATSRSRVTSWADSTIANTIVTPKAGDRSSLSIIDERESSIPQPESSGDNSITTWSPPRPDGMIDSQRLYSALMKRIDGNNKQNASEEIILGHVKEHRAIPTPAPSMYTRRSRQTIRLIASDESIQSPGSYTTAYAGTTTPRQSSQRVVQRTQGPQHLQKSEVCNPYASGELDPSIRATKETLGEDAKGVSLERPRSPDTELDSPSVYSRTTSGNSPSTMDLKIDANGPDATEEPGMATIFASQRAAYSSPKRSLGQGPVGSQRPSADWQQWMHTQMARIERTENLAPTRCHYREDAQIHDEGTAFAYRTPARDTGDFRHGLLEDDMWTTCKVSAKNNFSRPFSRSSSIRTTVAAPRERSNTPLPPPPPPISTSPKISSSSSGHSFLINQIETRPNSIALSPVHLLSNSRSRAPESPTPRRDAADKNQWQATSRKQGRYSSRQLPGTRDLKAFQGRSARAVRDNRRLTDENLRAENGYRDDTNQDSPLQSTYSPISSKRMVEMFLESRRQRGTEVPDEAASEGAFI